MTRSARDVMTHTSKRTCMRQPSWRGTSRSQTNCCAAPRRLRGTTESMTPARTGNLPRLAPSFRDVAQAPQGVTAERLPIHQVQLGAGTTEGPAVLSCAVRTFRCCWASSCGSRNVLKNTKIRGHRGLRPHSHVPFKRLGFNEDALSGILVICLGLGDLVGRLVVDAPRLLMESVLTRGPSWLRKVRGPPFAMLRALRASLGSDAGR